MNLSHAEAGAKGARVVRWREEPCPAELVIVADDQAIGRTFTCQRPQQWNGPLQRAHLVHMWRGVIDGRKVEVTWSDGGEP